MQSSADAAAAAAASGGTQREGQEPFSGSAVEWVLRKADESLDEIEENPPEYVKVLYDVSSGPIGARRHQPSRCLLGRVWRRWRAPFCAVPGCCQRAKLGGWGATWCCVPPGAP